MRPLLCRSEGDLAKILKMFDANVTQTVLWCSESWHVTKEELRVLKTTQNSMLRRIVGKRRAPDEPWLDWIKRSTRQAYRCAKECNIRMWLDAAAQSKWTWAGHVSRMDPERLALRSTAWRDSAWNQLERQLPEPRTRLKPCSHTSTKLKPNE